MATDFNRFFIIMLIVDIVLIIREIKKEKISNGFWIMKQKYTVFFPFSFEEIDAFDDNVDVCVIFDTGEEDTLLFGTPKKDFRMSIWY